MTDKYDWIDNPTVAGISEYNPDVLNECLMHLKYNNSNADTYRYSFHSGNVDSAGEPDLFDISVGTNIIYNTPGTYTVHIPISGNYEVVLVGGGAGGVWGFDVYAVRSTSSGGSGACFSGVIYIPAGTYSVTVGEGGTCGGNGEYGGAGGTTSIGNIISASGGAGGAYATWSQLNMSTGGVVSCSTTIISASINSSGNNGSTQYNGNSTGGASLYQGYGKGGDANQTDAYNGVSGFLSINRVSDNGYVNYKVGGNYPNLVGTTLNGEQFTIVGLNSDNISSLIDGKYIKYVGIGGDSVLRKNRYFAQRHRPNMGKWDVWHNTSVNPTKVYEWDGTNLIPFEKIPIGEITISNGTVISYKSYPFNQNGYSVNIQSAVGFPSARYVDFTLGANGTDYIAPANGWFQITKKVNANTSQNVGLFSNGVGIRTSSAKAGENIGACVPVKKGDIMNVSYTAGGDVLFFRFYYAEGVF